MGQKVPSGGMGKVKPCLLICQIKAVDEYVLLVLFNAIQGSIL